MSVHVPLALPSVASRDGIRMGVEEIDGDGMGVFVKIHPSGQASAVAEIHHVNTHPHGHQKIQLMIPFSVFSDAVFTSLHDGGNELDRQNSRRHIGGLQKKVAMISQVDEPPQGAQRPHLVAHSFHADTKNNALDNESDDLLQPGHGDDAGEDGDRP